MNTEVHIDLDKLEDDPALRAMVANILHTATAKQNMMTAENFRKYEIIFKLDGRTILGSDRFEQLCNEYYSQIDAYSPVQIVDSSNTVLFVLPAMFRKVNPVNFAGQAGMDINTAFINANNNEDSFGHKRKSYCDLYKRVITIAQNQSEKSKAVADAKRLSTAVTSKPDNVPIIPTETIENDDSTVEIL